MQPWGWNGGRADPTEVKAETASERLRRALKEDWEAHGSPEAIWGLCEACGRPVRVFEAPEEHEVTVCRRCQEDRAGGPDVKGVWG